MAKHNDGMIVTISSVMGLTGSATLSDYAASKHALLGMHESLRLELRKMRKFGIRMVLICPFAVSTGMFAGIFEGS